MLALPEAPAAARSAPAGLLACLLPGLHRPACPFPAWRQPDPLSLPRCLQVREYEASATLFAESRAKRSELQDVLKEHEGDLKALRQEMDVQVGGPPRPRSAPAGMLCGTVQPSRCTRCPASCDCPGRWALAPRGCFCLGVSMPASTHLSRPWPLMARPWARGSVCSSAALLAGRRTLATLPASAAPPPLPPAAPQRQILTKLREHERDIDREVEEVIAERRRCREVMVRPLVGPLSGQRPGCVLHAASRLRRRTRKPAGLA